MINLLDETVQDLIQNGKTEADVIWCGSNKFGYFSWDVFKKLANKEYDDGYGSPKVCEDLLVVGNDWWLERYEYDGAEKWVYKSMPKKPEKENIPKEVVDDSFMWVTLTEANADCGEHCEMEEV